VDLEALQYSLVMFGALITSKGPKQQMVVSFFVFEFAVNGKLQ